MDSWALIFQITAAFGFLATIIFSIYGSGKVQYWNEPLDKREDGNENGQNNDSAKEPLQRENGDAKHAI
jgi:hypothetical protein